MSRNNIIKEAIADAKATREAALENAKSMIVDAFTPALKGKISENLENGASGIIAEGGDQPASYDGGHPSQSGEDMLNKGDGSAGDIGVGTARVDHGKAGLVCPVRVGYSRSSSVHA